MKRPCLARRSHSQSKEAINLEAQPNDEGEVFGCPCGVRQYNETDGYMLDCDLCHRWFHGACMGVPESADEWYSDHCRLSICIPEL